MFFAESKSFFFRLGDNWIQQEENSGTFSFVAKAKSRCHH